MLVTPEEIFIFTKKYCLTLTYEVNPIHICTRHHCCLTRHP